MELQCRAAKRSRGGSRESGVMKKLITARVSEGVLTNNGEGS